VREARDMITRLSHPALGPLDVLGVPVKLSDTPGAVRTAPPTLGQHTQAVLSGDLGLSGEAISRLRASGVVK
jgi:crotonobetainyl-CoA:carnitine CoA-transferase CaiB-like acyl-CoA transferase